VTPATLLA
jgi:putative transposase